jgi:integrase
MPLRKNRSADNEQALIEAHVLTVGWFVAMDIKTVRPKHILRLVEAMRSAGKLAEKSIATVYSIVHGAFKRALFEDVISDDPCILPPKTIKWKSRNKRTPYTRSEAHALTTSSKVTLATRVWNTLAFYTRMRKGEICGRRWRDWARDARPLSELSVHSQYDDQPLKGDDDDQTRPRLVPVHPALEETLRCWWSEGFELVYCRKPTPDDFIVPSRFGGNLSKSGAFPPRPRNDRGQEPDAARHPEHVHLDHPDQVRARRRPGEGHPQRERSHDRHLHGVRVAPALRGSRLLRPRSRSWRGRPGL